MQEIKKKLSSRRGASLTFALLMFLVCAVVGSVVLTAGTAAAGRMSQIAEMDQRYYSVNSAARLLIDLLENKEIRYEENKSEETPEGDPEDAADQYIYYINGTKYNSTNTTESEKLALALDTAKRVLDMKENNSGTGVEPRKLSLDITTPIEGADLKVTIEEEIQSSGDLKCSVKNTNTEKGQYIIDLYFMNIGTASSFQWKLYDIDSRTLSNVKSTN